MLRAPQARTPADLPSALAHLPGTFTMSPREDGPLDLTRSLAPAVSHARVQSQRHEVGDSAAESGEDQAEGAARRETDNQDGCQDPREVGLLHTPDDRRG